MTLDLGYRRAGSGLTRSTWLGICSGLMAVTSQSLTVQSSIVSRMRAAKHPEYRLQANIDMVSSDIMCPINFSWDIARKS